MELRAKRRNRATGGHRTRAARRENTAVGGAVRVYVEGLVFLDDPPIVGDGRQSGDARAIAVAVGKSLRIHHVDLQIAGGGEADGRCSSGRSSLGILYRVGEVHRGSCRVRRQRQRESALGIRLYGSAGNGRSRRGDQGEGQVIRVGIAQQQARRRNFDVGCRLGCVALG